MRDAALITKYLQTLDAAAPPGRQKEQVVQEFLESNTELIPTPNRLNHHLHFRSIISKFPLSTALITDYAYLTKSSDSWRVTLVELESPDKDIFNRSTKVVAKSSAFNAAIDQVRSWQQHMKKSEPEVHARLQPLLQPLGMRGNPIEYHYQLIYGRSANKNLTSQRKQEFQSIQQDLGISILTFDQLVSWYQNDLVFKKSILRVARQGYEFKAMGAGPSSILAYLGPGELFLSDAQTKALETEGYDMDAWRRGELLVFNDKYPRSAMGSLP